MQQEPNGIWGGTYLLHKAYVSGLCNEMYYSKIYVYIYSTVAPLLGSWNSPLMVCPTIIPVYIYIYIWIIWIVVYVLYLLGGVSTPLKNIKVSQLG